MTDNENSYVIGTLHPERNYSAGSSAWHGAVDAELSARSVRRDAERSAAYGLASSSGGGYSWPSFGRKEKEPAAERTPADKAATVFAVVMILGTAAGILAYERFFRGAGEVTKPQEKAEIVRPLDPEQKKEATVQYVAPVQQTPVADAGMITEIRPTSMRQRYHSEKINGVFVQVPYPLPEYGWKLVNGQYRRVHFVDAPARPAKAAVKKKGATATAHP